MGCICLIPSNKCSKPHKIIKILDNTDNSTNNINIGQSTSRIISISKEVIDLVTPSLWLIILQYLSIDDLIQVSHCNKELKGIVRQNRNNYKGYTDTCVININKEVKADDNSNKNISKEALPTVVNTNLLSMGSKMYNTHSFKVNISSFSSKNNQVVDIAHCNRHSKTIKNNDKLIPVYTHSSEPTKSNPNRIKVPLWNSNSKNGNCYIDTFTQQQIDLSNNSLSINRKKSLSNLSLDFENKTPSFSEDNSADNQIVNITNINTINITPIIVNNTNSINANTNTNSKVKGGNGYFNLKSPFKKKDTGG